MASWDELRETMRQSYKLQQDEADYWFDRRAQRVDVALPDLRRRST